MKALVEQLRESESDPWNAIGLFSKAADEIERLQDQRRDMMAAAALQGMLANPEYEPVSRATIIEYARMDADSMIAELDRSRT